MFTIAQSRLLLRTFLFFFFNLFVGNVATIAFNQLKAPYKFKRIEFPYLEQADLDIQREAVGGHRAYKMILGTTAYMI